MMKEWDRVMGGSMLESQHGPKKGNGGKKEKIGGMNSLYFLLIHHHVYIYKRVSLYNR